MKQSQKRTRDILKEEASGHKRNNLYDSNALMMIETALDHWKNTVLSEEDREEWSKRSGTVLGSNIPKEFLYTPLNNSGFDYLDDLGFPGLSPFTRGIHPNMYRGKKFTMRQLTGFGSPEQTNQRVKFMLDHGATGLNILFDLPTIQMYDSDAPFSEGQVGMSGVCVDSVEDMALIFKGIPVEDISISIVTHYPSNTAILFPMFLVFAEERGVPWDRLRGSVQNDITLEELVRSGSEFIPPDDCFRIQCDNIEFISKNLPKWNFITLNGYNLREFGTSPVTEMAVAISNGIETVEEMVKRGHKVDDFAPRIAFFWSIGNDFFEEIARLRAARRLWYKIMKYKFKAINPRSMWMRCHVQTSGVSLVQQEPLNNIVRSAYHALAAVLGGVQSLHVDSFDEAYSVPTEEAALLSLRTQQVLQDETGIADVVDPLGGSFYIESLTQIYEEKILEEVDEIERTGGYIANIENGVLHKKITGYFLDQQKGIEDGEIKIVASNVYKSRGKPASIDVFRYPSGVEEQQKKKLKKLRRTRDNQRVRQTLLALERACKLRENIFSACIECARARCTEGEMFKVFKETFGLWRPSVI